MTKRGILKSLVHLAALAIILACTIAITYASSPVTKGGVVKTVDLERQTFTVAGAITLGYDYQGLPGKSGNLSIKYTRNTVFLLDGVLTPPAQALKPGRVMKRAWVKHGGYVELFSADSPLLDCRNATLSLGCVVMGEKGGKAEATGFLTIRMEWRDGRLTRIFAVPFAGCHPSLYGAEVAVEAGGLKFAEGKLEGAVKISSQPPTTLELHAAAEGAVVRGAFTGTQGEQKVQGYVNGEFDYPETAAAPATAYFFLEPGWDGGAVTTPPVLVTMTATDAATTTVTLTPYNGTARLDAQMEKPVVKLHPDVEGSFTVKVDSDVYQPGVYTIALTGKGTGQMGLSGAVGTAILSERRGYQVTKDGQPGVKASTEFFVRNARRLMPAP